MGENGSRVWKVATAVCAVLLVGAIVALIVLVASGGDDGDKKAMEDKVGALEEQVSQQERQIDLLERELAEAEAGDEAVEEDEEDVGEEVTAPSDQEQLEALAEQYTDANFHVGEIVIVGDWARVGIAPNDPTAYQGELVYYHKIDGEWTYVDAGTGLQYGDIPGAPESLFP